MFWWNRTQSAVILHQRKIKTEQCHSADTRCSWIELNAAAFNIIVEQVKRRTQKSTHTHTHTDHMSRHWACGIPHGAFDCVIKYSMKSHSMYHSRPHFLQMPYHKRRHILQILWMPTIHEQQNIILNWGELIQRLCIMPSILFNIIDICVLFKVQFWFNFQVNFSLRVLRNEIHCNFVLQICFKFFYVLFIWWGNQWNGNLNVIRSFHRKAIELVSKI